MINRELINPQSIVVVGGSNNVHKPGGRLVRNLLDGKYKGELYVVNAKEDDVQGLKSYHSVHDIPETELAIISTQPIPEFHADGVDFISSSGGTALFIIESALTKGLRFSSVWSVGNSKQIGVEEVIEYMDRNFDPVLDSKIKMLYIEQIKNPDKLLYHASSLIRKG